MSGEEADEEFAEVEFYAYPCDCGSRSWEFPVLVDVIVADRGVNAHWRDGVGWDLCDLDAEVFANLSSIPGSMSYEEYREMGRGNLAVANGMPIEHWRPLWQAYLDKELARAENVLEMAERIVVKERNRLRLAACRAAAARIEDPATAAAAHRLLAQNLTAGPAELLATAAIVVS